MIKVRYVSAGFCRVCFGLRFFLFFFLLRVGMLRALAMRAAIEIGLGLGAGLAIGMGE